MDVSLYVFSGSLPLGSCQQDEICIDMHPHFLVYLQTY